MKKKNTILGIVFLSLLVILFSGCEEWVNDIDPGDVVVNSTFLEHVRDLDKVLNGGYAALLGENGEGLAASPFLISALSSDLMKPFPPKEDEIPEELMNIYLRKTGETGPNDYAWKYMKYLSIAANNANMIIDALESGKLTDDPDINDTANVNRLLGESYMLRALCNFELTKLLGKQYNRETSGTDLAGYYSLKPVMAAEDLPTQRKTVQESYNQLILDAKKAMELLPVTYDNTIHTIYYDNRRFNQDAALALLAKIYFQMNDFENTKTAIDSLLGPTPGQSERYPLAEKVRDLYKDVLGAKDDNPNAPYEESEIICDFYGNTIGDGPNNNRHAWAWMCTPSEDLLDFLSPADHRGNLGDQGKGYFVMAYNFIDYTHFDWWDDDRGYIELIDELVFDDGETWELTSWPIKFARKGLNVSWYRSGEFFLMRSECNARLGFEEEAIADLDAIKERGGRYDLYEDESDPMPSLVEEIIRERARELFLENYRLWDLLRLGAQDGRRVPQGERTQDEILAGDETGVPWDDPVWVYPLPDINTLYELED